MRATRLWLTEEFDHEEAKALVSTLRSYLPIDTPRFVVRRSAEGLQQYVQLLGSWETWTAALEVFAAAFLAKLGQHSADVLWETARDWLKRGEAKPLADVSEALSGLAPRAQIVIGLDVPEGYFGTTFVIGELEQEKIACALARFVDMSEKISLIMQMEIEAGRGPLGRTTVTFLEEGGVELHWMTQSFITREFRIAKK